MENIKIGCCGYPVSKQKYVEQFKLVEIQKTFYTPPQNLSTVEKWRSEVPEDFEFTIKAWQLITHPSTSPTYRKLKIKNKNLKNCGYFHPTNEVFKAWEMTEQIASILKSKIVVFQSPASFKPIKENKKNMIKFFKTIDRKNFLFVWEPRGEWKDGEVKDLCKELDLAHCVDPFKNESTYGKIKYYRLHGKAGYRYKYTDEDLVYLKKLTTSARGGSALGRHNSLLTTEVYILFNNIYMYEDALKFKKLINN